MHGVLDKFFNSFAARSRHAELGYLVGFSLPLPAILYLPCPYSSSTVMCLTLCLVCNISVQIVTVGHLGGGSSESQGQNEL
jgi:hypothetical protein